MILNWKNTGARGYHARVQIIDRHLSATAAGGGPPVSVQIVNILVDAEEKYIGIQVREEGGAAYDWPAAVDPFTPGSATPMVEDEGERVMMACVEDWLDILSGSYYVYEVAL